MTVLRVCYRQGASFDEKYYFEKHIPLAGPIMAALGARTSEVLKVSGSVAGFSTPYQYVFSAYFDSPIALEQCMQSPKMAIVLADVPNYFTGESDVMVGETVG